MGMIVTMVYEDLFPDEITIEKSNKWLIVPRQLILLVWFKELFMSTKLSESAFSIDSINIQSML